MSDVSEADSSTTVSSATCDWPVTEEWLQGVLRSHHHRKSKTTPQNQSSGQNKTAEKRNNATTIAIVDFNVRPGCDSCDSVLSDILAVCVHYTIIEEQPEQPPKAENNDHAISHNLELIVKLLPQDPFSRFFVTEAQFDLREIKFYTKIVPDLESLIASHPIRLPIPQCYYAHYAPAKTEPDPIPPESVLVLENVRPAGYTGSDFAHGLTLVQTKAAIDSIATVHALALTLKVTADKSRTLSERYPFLFQTAQASDSYQQLVEKGLPQLEAFLEKRDNLAHISEDLNRLRPHTKEIIENLLAPEEPMALITHTDFWCNNLMFKQDENQCHCVILDWQMVTHSRPTNDLALLLVSSVAAELRRTQTEALLDDYWSRLTATCKCLGVVDIETGLGYDRVKLGEDYKKSQLLALLLCIGSIDLALGNQQMEDRLVALLQDLHDNGLLNVEVARKNAC